jgi:hypothetical protein
MSVQKTSYITSRAKGSFLVAGCALALMISITPTCWAQAEINPDHFDDQPASAAVKVTALNPRVSSFTGKVTLRRDVEYRGVTLPPGSYSVSVRSLGKTNIVTLVSDGSAVKGQAIQARASSHSSAGVPNALVLECRGHERTLAAIHLNDLTLDLHVQQGRNASVHTELVPIVATAGGM